MSEKTQLTSADIRSPYWRSTFLLGSFHFERMQSMGFCVSMIPTLKRLYSKKEDQAPALKRPLAVFNKQPRVGSALVGVTAALEQMGASGGQIDDAAGSGGKGGVRGPLAGGGGRSFGGRLGP
ncbi:PTS system mannose/fructose/sorbose family transporter subunit IID, partial [[Pasteurella] aerogenes]